MGKAVTRMREILNSTGAYALTGETPADWELNAWGAGFDDAEAEIDGLLENLFAATASSASLSAWETLSRPQTLQGTLAERRAVTGARLAMTPARFTLQDVSQMLLAAGVEGTVQETSSGLKVIPEKLLGVSEAEAKRELELTLPAHLPWEWDGSKLA